ncbi:sel1 repeat family protein [bacterium]|nr:sel1 repeat family protein [bacterium]
MEEDTTYVSYLNERLKDEEYMAVSLVSRIEDMREAIQSARSVIQSECEALRQELEGLNQNSNTEQILNNDKLIDVLSQLDGQGYFSLAQSFWQRNNQEEAVHYYSLAQKRGILEAGVCGDIARYFFNKKDYHNCFLWAKIGADLNNPESQYLLACIYHEGLGETTKNILEAVELYGKAEEQGHSEAMCKLAEFYYERECFTESFEQAQKAVANGNNSAREIMEKARRKLGKRITNCYADKQVGDRFCFGRYPQGPNGEIKPITWRVLRRDSDSLLVIAEMGLDAKPYNEEYKPITWADCTLRRWLNDEFYKKAFNEQEQSLIKKTALANNAGLSTEDNVFLLSVDEAESLFANRDDRCCKPTDYAVKNGAWQYNGDNVVYKENAWWWLRSRGDISSYAARVRHIWRHQRLRQQR